MDIENRQQQSYQVTAVLSEDEKYVNVRIPILPTHFGMITKSKFSRILSSSRPTDWIKVMTADGNKTPLAVSVTLIAPANWDGVIVNYDYFEILEGLKSTQEAK